jgi:hypothetical protein
VAEREASGDFDYLFDDPTDADDSSGADAPPEPVAPEDFDYALRDDDQWDDPDDNFWSNDSRADGDGSFDAFDANTWYYEPAPTPWYRTKQAMTAFIAVAASTVALVVSGVLLVFRVPSTAGDETPLVTPTAPSTAAPTQMATSAAPPPPQAPPPQAPPPQVPPPQTSAAPIDVAPAETYRPRSPLPRTTKEPEIGVTRTPVTRSPMSVAPQRPGSRN